MVCYLTVFVLETSAKALVLGEDEGCSAFLTLRFLILAIASNNVEALTHEANDIGACFLESDSEQEAATGVFREIG